MLGSNQGVHRLCLGFRAYLCPTPTTVIASSETLFAPGRLLVKVIDTGTQEESDRQAFVREIIVMHPELGHPVHAGPLILEVSDSGGV